MAGRPRREGTEPAIGPPPAPGRRGSDLVQGPDPGAEAPRRLRDDGGGAADRDRDPDAEPAHCAGRPKGVPRSAPTIETLDRLQAAFPGQASPAIVAVKTDTNAPAFTAALDGLGAAVVASHQGYGAISTGTNPAHTAAGIQVPLPGSGTDTTSTDALLRLRGRLLPQTVGKIPGAVYALTRQTASSYDGNLSMKSSLPIVFAFVLTLAFLLLLASFRSLVIAAKSIVLNLLSVAAVYGVVVAVFQYGWGQHVLGFQSNSAIARWLPRLLSLDQRSWENRLSTLPVRRLT